MKYKIKYYMLSESLKIELKEFFVKKVDDNDKRIEEKILSGVMYPNDYILKSLESDILKYIPKYISCWNNSSICLSEGELYFGVKDDGTIVGIPYDGKLDENIIYELLLKTRDSLSGDNIDIILSSIKISLMEIKPIETDMLLEYNKEIDKQERSLIVYKKQVRKYLEWHRDIIDWHCKIINILNNEEKKRKFIIWLEQYCNVITKNEIINEVKKWKYKSNFDFMVTDMKDDIYGMIHWLCLFKDLTMASKKRRPIISSIYSPNWLKFYNTPYLMNSYISKINPSVKFYLLKFSIPNKKQNIFVRNKKKWVQYIRMEGKLGPCSIPINEL